MAFHPIPYYIVAFLLLIVFGYLWPVLPISGGCADEHAARLRAATSSAACCSTPSCRCCRWCWSARRLVHGHALAGLQHRHRGLRRLCRAGRRRAAAASCAPTSCATRWCRRSPASPCRSARIFNGAIITEQVFGYPGIGTLLVSAVHAGDYSLVLGITSVSIVAVSVAVLLIDLLYPLLDPRVKVALMMGASCATSCATTASSPSASSCWRSSSRSRRCRSSRPIRRTTSTSCRPTCRRPGPTRSAPPRAARTCSGS